MGMFKSMRDLQKQANEINKDWDPGQQMQDGMAQMQAANEMMAQQTAAANAAMNGTPAKAGIVEVRQSGGMVNYQPMIEVDLNVMREGAPPYPATVKQVIEQIYLPKAVAGASVNVKIDPSDQNVVWIDWATS
jgi:hypothetical protein